MSRRGTPGIWIANAHLSGKPLEHERFGARVIILIRIAFLKYIPLGRPL
jgi:hypothetical protein